MELPLSRSQIERLGERLVHDPKPEDFESLHRILEVYGEVLDETVARVRGELRVAPTSRVKTTGTIVEKLKREGGSWLKSMQDIAGMRVVDSATRVEQDELVGRFIGLFAGDVKPAKAVDRRLRPSFGYRAVHVIAYPYGIPVEIQVRTRLQHEWAEVFEKLADRVGRGIRYGGPPEDIVPPAVDDEEIAAAVREVYESAFELRVAIVANAISLADLIDGVEAEEAEAPGAPELAVYRADIASELRDLRRNVSEVDERLRKVERMLSDADLLSGT